MKDPHRSIYCP